MRLFSWLVRLRLKPRSHPTHYIYLTGYTYDEKMHIARRFLLPKQLTANGLDKGHITILEPALLRIATRYTREAGVRSLERAIGGVVRYKAVEWAEFVDALSGGVDARRLIQGDELEKEKDVIEVEGTGGGRRRYKRVVEEHELEKILGVARWDGEEREREERRGVVYGLVVMGQGEGGIMPVETIAVPGSGKLKLTGSLGDVSRFRCASFLFLRAWCWVLNVLVVGYQGEWRACAELGQDARV